MADGDEITVILAGSAWRSLSQTLRRLPDAFAAQAAEVIDGEIKDLPETSPVKIRRNYASWSRLLSVLTDRLLDGKHSAAFAGSSRAISALSCQVVQAANRQGATV